MWLNWLDRQTTDGSPCGPGRQRLEGAECAMERQGEPPSWIGEVTPPVSSHHGSQTSWRDSWTMLPSSAERRPAVAMARHDRAPRMPTGKSDCADSRCLYHPAVPRSGPRKWRKHENSFLAVLLASSVAGFSAANAAGGCGPGFHHGPYGGCVGNRGVIVVRPPVVVERGFGRPDGEIHQLEYAAVTVSLKAHPSMPPPSRLAFDLHPRQHRLQHVGHQPLGKAGEEGPDQHLAIVGRFIGTVVVQDLDEIVTGLVGG